MSDKAFRIVMLVLLSLILVAVVVDVAVEIRQAKGDIRAIHYPMGAYGPR